MQLPSNRMADGASVFQSKVITCLVGDQKAPMTAHIAALRRCSQWLANRADDRLGPPTASKVVDFADVDVSTFERVCQYGYSGNYASPALHAPQTEEAAADTVAVERVPARKSKKAADSSWGFTRPPSPPSPARPLHEALQRAFQNLSFHHGVGGDEGVKRPEWDCDQRTDDIHIVVEAHVKVYLFAHGNSCEHLQSLCLQKLTNALASYEVKEPGDFDPTWLVKHAYGAHFKDLREVTIAYLTSMYGKTGATEPFRALLRAGGQFTADFNDALHKAVAAQLDAEK
jgi:hypothetical protein